MAGVDNDEEIRGPLGVTHDDDEPDGFVKVTAVIPDFEVSTKVTLKGKKVTPGKGAVVDVEYKECSVLMNATIKDKKKKDIKYRWKIKKLIDTIVPEESYTKYEKGKIIMYLKKEDNHSWVADIMTQGGLEMETEN